nr:helicase [Pandoravirus massiliensis]
MNDSNRKGHSKDGGAELGAQRTHGLATALLPHQIEAVEWMRSRERASHPGGGVLADDMGMGKTLDCIALVASTASKEPLREQTAPPLHNHLNESTGGICAASSLATLVVAPLCLMDQWRLQIERHTRGCAKTLVYHGAGRQTALASFLRDESTQNADATHDVVDGATAMDEPNICADNAQCLRHAEDTTKPHITIRFVLTTYEIVQREHVVNRHSRRQHHRTYKHDTTISNTHKECDGIDDARQRVGHIQSVFDILWFRIVLDEAHRIRTPGSAAHDAVMALRAPRRWCVTGTPYNNSCRDLQALARFIGASPYRDAAWWETPPGGSQPSTDGRVDRWARQFVLMRDKKRVLGDTLPSCTASSMRIRMDRAERAFYDDLVRSALRAYEAFAAAPPRDRAKPRMFGAVLAWVGRLRQACNHPLLAMGRGWRDGAPQTARCGCCARPFDNDPAGGGPGTAASCGHRLCALCAPASTTKAKSSRVRSTCLACDAAARWSADDDPAHPRPSTKMRTLVTYCADALASDPTARVVVFSQWTACLDLAEGFLREAKIASVRYDGDVSGIARRAAVLAAFGAASAPLCDDSHGPPSTNGVQVPSTADNAGDGSARPGPMTLRSGTTLGRPENARVLLASLHCAGVGLDLSAANHVVLVDAWYNPFIEKQACDRVHRIGQTREVKVLRLFAASSVEADVARIQARKLREAAALGLDSRGSTATTTPTAPMTDNVHLASSDLDKDNAQSTLSETDIHEIFRRAMTRCRLCPIPTAPPTSHNEANHTVVTIVGKRKRE